MWYVVYFLLLIILLTASFVNSAYMYHSSLFTLLVVDEFIGDNYCFSLLQQSYDYGIGQGPNLESHGKMTATEDNSPY